ncbi:MAG: YbaB/EbfC family nucleoid-associated protein [Verrucomicrobium sp.]|nr:YbaB/EbfC family nucleoid-associated protein [Verrucomicrobium sp.]
MNIAKLMKQAQQMQAQAQKIQADLAAKEYQGTSGGGAVSATASGDGQLLKLKIDPAILKDGDAEIVEDLVLSAVRDALEQGRKDAASEMGKLTGGLGLPGF